MKQTEFSKTIMKQRYAYPGESTWKDIANRVSSAIASAEFNGDVETYEKRFYEVIESGDFIPGGRILYGANRHGTGLMNCFALEFEDNRHSIAEVLSDTYLISTSGGGCFDPNTTEIYTDRGPIKMDSIKPDDKILSYNIEDDKFEFKELLNIIPNNVSNKEIVNIELEDGKVITCTADHEFLTKNRGYVEAKKLTSEDELVNF